MRCLGSTKTPTVHMPQSKMWQTSSSGNCGLGEGPLADFMGVLAWMVGCLMVFVGVVTWMPVLHRIPLSQVSRT